MPPKQQYAKPPAKKPSFPVVIATSAEAVVHYDHIQSPDTEGEYADGKYKVTLLFSKDADMSDLKTACDQVAAAEFGRPGPVCWRDGDATGRDDYAGSLVMTAKSNYQPKIYNTDAIRLDVEDEDGNRKHVRIGRGARVRVEIQAIPHRAGGGPGVAARLLAVQLIAPGEAVGGESSFARAAAAQAVSESQRAALRDLSNKVAKPTAAGEDHLKSIIARVKVRDGVAPADAN